MMNWIWLGAVVAFGVLEAATAALVSIWFVGGAAVALLASFFRCGAVASDCPVSGGLRGYSGGGPAPDEGANAKPSPRIWTGSSAVLPGVTEEIDNEAGTGAVYVEGKTWTARSSDGTVLPIGTRVIAERMEGVKLLCEAGADKAQRGRADRLTE